MQADLRRLPIRPSLGAALALAAASVGVAEPSVALAAAARGAARLRGHSAEGLQSEQMR